MREQAEALTIAYIAIGVLEAWNEANDEDRSIITDRFEGQIGVVGEAIQHALMLDRMADVAETEIDGCFAYEVAEEFGREFTRQLLSGDASPMAYSIGFQLMGEITK